MERLGGEEVSITGVEKEGGSRLVGVGVGVEGRGDLSGSSRGRLGSNAKGAIGLVSKIW